MEQSISNSKVVWKICLTTTIAVCIAGGGVYFWQRADYNVREQKLEQQIDQLKQENIGLKVTTQPVSTKTLNTSDSIKLPVVVYARPGLLFNTEQGRLEKINLEKKLISPYMDYYNEKQINLISLLITIPENIGEWYGVDAIFRDGMSEGFMFGKREGEYDYWKPDCMGECEFSDAFRKKYPQIVNNK
ncbi:MAG: hypothetical protein EXS55_01520 [Candidatus Magasanikbacteria bacterium]|nr:hypothetical protein [Candidatus Magasanikbacteria bacterium]